MNEPFKIEVFLPHQTTTAVVLTGFGVRVSATRSSVKAAVEDALREWTQRVTEPLIRAARSARAVAAKGTTFPRVPVAPPLPAPEEEAPAGPLPDGGPLFTGFAGGPTSTAGGGPFPTHGTSSEP